MKTKIYGDNYEYDCRNCTEHNCAYKFLIPPFTCSKCGKEISKRQFTDTCREYSFALCPDCQYEFEKKLEDENNVFKRAVNYLLNVFSGLAEVVRNGRK